MVAENISVLISVAKRGPVQNLIPTTLGPITVQLAWTISFSAEDVANIGREEAVFPSKIMFVRNVKKNFKFKARNPGEASRKQSIQTSTNAQNTKLKKSPSPLSSPHWGEGRVRGC
jgi:hypothetical protein